MKRPVLLAFLLLIVALVCLGVFYSFDFGAAREVRITEVRLSDLHADINTNGKVEAEKVYELRATGSGVCRRIFAREGARLRAGDPILAEDDSSLNSELALARAELVAAELELRNVRRGPLPEELNKADAEMARLRSEVESARKIVETNEALLGKNAISRFEVEESRRALTRAEQSLAAAVTLRADLQKRYDETDRRHAEARVEAAKSRISYLERSISDSVLRAPANGTLYQFDVKDGAYLNKGDLAGLLADLTVLRVRAFVDEPELGRVAEGSEVTVRWDARPGESWKGTVTRLPAQVVARGSRSVGEVLCSLSSPQQVLIPNINVDVEIETAQGPKIAALPRECVIPEGNEYIVWMMIDGRAVKRRVRVGRSTATIIEVAGGVAVGDRVIVPGDFPLAEGMKVRVAVR